MITNKKIFLYFSGLILIPIILYWIGVIDTFLFIATTAAIFYLAAKFLLAADKTVKRKVETAAYKAKSLTISLFLFVLTIIGGILIYYESIESYRVYRFGTDTVGIVTDTKEETRRMRKGRFRWVHRHTLSFDGQVVAVELNRQYPIGTQLFLRYIPKEPNAVKLFKPGDSLYSLLFTRVFITALVMLLAFGGTAIYYLFRAFNPSVLEKN